MARIWKYIGSRRQGRTTLSEAIQALVKSGGDDSVSGIYNQETGQAFTKTGERAFLVSETQMRIIYRALGLVLLANKNSQPVPEQVFNSLLANAGEPFVSSAVADAKTLARKIVGEDDAGSGSVLGQDT